MPAEKKSRQESVPALVAVVLYLSHKYGKNAVSFHKFFPFFRGHTVDCAEGTGSSRPVLNVHILAVAGDAIGIAAESGGISFDSAICHRVLLWFCGIIPVALRYV